MTKSVLFSPRLITTLKSLDENDQMTMTAALASEFLLGVDVMSRMSGSELMIYAILRGYVLHDNNVSQPLKMAALA